MLSLCAEGIYPGLVRLAASPPVLAADRGRWGETAHNWPKKRVREGRFCSLTPPGIRVWFLTLCVWRLHVLPCTYGGSSGSPGTGSCLIVHREGLWILPALTPLSAVSPCLFTERR